MTNPASSGGAGTLFEANVGASYLLSLLLEVDARGLPGCRIDSVRFQRGQEGHPLDDLVIQGTDRSGDVGILDAQVKRSMTFTASDAEFRDVVKQIGSAAEETDFWNQNRQLGIAIERTTQKTESAYQDVLSWARSLEDASTFHKRIHRPRAANDSMRSFVAVFRENLRTAGFAHDDTTVWRLLQRIQILVFDFTSPASATAELMRERALRALDGGNSDESRKLWSCLTELALETASTGGSLTRADLISELQTFRLAGSRNNRRAMETLFQESELALSGFEDKVAGVTLLRPEWVEAVRDAMSRARYVEVRGDAGVGKSGLLRRIADDLGAEARLLVLSPNRVTGRGWLALKGLTGYDGDGRDLMNELSLSGASALLIDNLDFYSPEEQTTVRDLVTFASRHPTISVVATARPDFAEIEENWLPKDALIRLGQTSPVLINELTDSEVDELRDGAPRLTFLLSDTHPAKEIVRNLFRLSRLADNPEAEPWPATEAEMARRWWELAAGKGDEHLRDRSRLLRKLAEHSLVSREPLDVTAEKSEIVDGLKRLGALREFSPDRVAFRHDVLREWAIANLIFEARGFSSIPGIGERASADRARGAELAARMALEDADGVSRWQELVASLGSSHETWRRAVVLALVRSENAIKLLVYAGSVLLADDAVLFKDLVHYVLAVEFETAARRLQGKGFDLEKVGGIWQIPRNSSAAHLVLWQLSVSKSLPFIAIPEAVKLYSSYVMGTLGGDPLTPLILPELMTWLSQIEEDREKDPYEFRTQVFDGAVVGPQLKVVEEECRTTILFFGTRLPTLAASYLLSFKGRKHMGEVRMGILKLRGSLAQAAPKEFADFAIDTLVNSEPKGRRNRDDLIPRRPFEDVDSKFMPASPAQGPFLDLLVHAPQEGLRLVRHVVSHAVRFYRGDQLDKDAAVVYLDGKTVSYPWPDFYQWSREMSSAPSLVTSALMALEAWAHRRIEAGDKAEEVIADIVGDTSLSSSVLLLAVDVVISHWPKTSEAAIPFVACPELLCVELGRPGRDNVVLPDLPLLRELRALQTEPVGLATLDSLKQRPSRRYSLYNLLSNFTFGPPEANTKVRTLLKLAEQRLGSPEKHSHLGDPRMMAVHALNVLDPANWVSLKDANGEDSGKLYYKAPADEERQMEPIRKEATPRVEENSLRMAILNELYANANTTPEFLSKALSWAKQHDDVFDKRPDFDWSGEHSTMVGAVVSCAALVARNGTPELLADEGAWVRSMFERAHEGNVDPAFLMREGVKFNPRAIAFVGQVMLLQRGRQPGDEARLMRFAATEGYATAHGYGAVLPTLELVDARLVPALLRCAFEAAVKPEQPWNISDDVKRQHQALTRERIEHRVREEVKWLGGEITEPSWPLFPTKRVRPRRRPKVAPPDAGLGKKPGSLEHRIDYHRAALWLKLSRLLMRGPAPEWSRAVTEVYTNWTLEANGFGEDKEESFEKGPSEWNEIYFELAARCMANLDEDAFDKRLVQLFGGLPDEPFMDCFTPFVRSADVAHFDYHTLTVTQLLRLRTYLIGQLKTTRMFSWNKDREETSVTSDVAPVFGALCFNDYNSLGPSKCYVPANLIGGIDPFLQMLEDFVADCRSPFLTFLYLNLFEVCPHREQLSCVLGCCEKWLSRFPESNRFWVEWGVGKRIASVFIMIFQVSPDTFDDSAIRSRIDGVLGQLVGLGVPEAHEMETLLYRGAS